MNHLAHLSPQQVLETLIVDRGEDFSSLSRLLGRNAAYIQQFIKRGTPKRLAEDDRRTLARYFGVDEAILGASALTKDVKLAEVPILDVAASAGPGAFSGHESKLRSIGFDPRWLRALTGGGIDGLSVIQVRGDSMVPTLADGDDVIVDRSDGASRLRDGIYVLRLDDQLIVKRVGRVPSGAGVVIRSDNLAYPEWRPDSRQDLDVVGRVLWFGRRVA